MKISVIDPSADSRWDHFVADHQHSTVFHTSAWARVIQDTYGYLGRYCVIENQAGQLVAAIPFYFIQSRLTGRRLISLPFSDHCCPLVEKEDDITLLLNWAKKELSARRASHLEIRGWHCSVPPDELGLVARHYNSLYVASLEMGDGLKGRLHHRAKRGIGQAEKQGVAIRFTTSEEGMKEFYKLNVATRKKHGVFPQPNAFFRAIHRHLIAQDLGFLMLAEWEGKVIAGSLFLAFKDTVYYKFNASDVNYLRQRPNHLLIWKAMQHACSEGYRNFDFGRCSSEDEGLHEFKAQWSSRKIDLPYYYYPDINGVTATTESGLKYRAMGLVSHVMPEFAFRAAGTALYRHLG